MLEISAEEEGLFCYFDRELLRFWEKLVSIEHMEVQIVGYTISTHGVVTNLKAWISLKLKYLQKKNQ